MKLIYKDPGYMYSTESISEFIKQSEYWSEAIFHFFPDLIKFKGLYDKKSKNKDIVEAISKTVLQLYNSRKSEIENKTQSYQEHWNLYEEIINQRFSSIFGFDTRDIFNDLICNITINPISPRYLKTRVFDVFYLNSDEGSLGSALHEISHFLWFHLWSNKYRDSSENYETPSLIWVLSEAVIEQILNDETLNSINPYHKEGNAYSYFYKMTVKGNLLYNYLDDFYKNSIIDEFMDKSFRFMLDNEAEIRSQML